MARLNIEDPFWLEVLNLVSEMGCQDKAIGNAVRFFRFAQQKYGQGQTITEQEFKRLGFSESLIGIFCERTESGIQAIGADKHFGWLMSRAESGRLGGKASAQRQRDERGRLMAKNNQSEEPEEVQANTKQNEANPSKLKQHQASYSFSSSKELNTAVSSKPKRQLKLFKPQSVEELKAGIDEETKATWRELYPDNAYLSRETIKAFAYYRDAGAKCPTTLSGWKKALGSWLERGWSRHAAQIPVKTNEAQASGASNSDWVSEEALILRRAIKHFGAYSGDGAKNWLGPERWAVVQALGGWAAVCRMPDDQFWVLTVTKAIKQVNQQQEKQGA
jgi:hypothetical protein